MKTARILAVISLLMLSAMPLSAQLSSPETLLILKPVNQSDLVKYPSSPQIGQIVENTLFNFIGTIPSLDVPSRQELSNIRNLPAPDALKRTGARMALTTAFSLSGTPVSATAHITITLWDARTEKPLLEKTYQTPTDLDLFDSLDTISAETASAALKTRIETATLTIGPLDIGEEPHFVYVNKKLLAIATNNGYTHKIQIVADTPYEVQISKLYDMPLKDQQTSAPQLAEEGFNLTKINPFVAWKLKNVLTRQLRLKPAESATVELKTKSSLQIFPIRNARSDRKYSLYINDSLFKGTPEGMLTFPGGRYYTLSIRDNLTNEILNRKLFLSSDYLNPDQTPKRQLVTSLHPQQKGVLWDYSSLQLEAQFLLGSAFAQPGLAICRGLKARGQFFWSGNNGSDNPAGIGIDILLMRLDEYSVPNEVGITTINSVFNRFMLSGHNYLWDNGVAAFQMLYGIGVAGINDPINLNNSVYTNSIIPQISLGTGILLMPVNELLWNNEAWIDLKANSGGIYPGLYINSSLEWKALSWLYIDAGLTSVIHAQMLPQIFFGTGSHYGAIVAGHAGVRLQWDF